MEQPKIKIKCPCCGAVLSVKPQPGMETKNVTCPICKERNPFMKFRKMVAAPARNMGGGAQSEDCTSYRDPSEMAAPEEQGMGFLNVLTPVKMTYKLKTGRNVIGRKASASAADLQIPNDTNKLLSREHLVVEVKKVPGKGFVHFASLFKEKVNATFVNDERLEYGDCIVLNAGDILKLPDCNIKFEMPDEG